MTNDGNFRCSFCGKERDAVRLLLAGPNVYICNECVRLCADIIMQKFAETPCPTIEAPTAPIEETPCPT